MIDMLEEAHAYKLADQTRCCIEDDMFKESDEIGASPACSQTKNMVGLNKAVGILGIIPIFDPKSS